MSSKSNVKIPFTSPTLNISFDLALFSNGYAILKLNECSTKVCLVWVTLTIKSCLVLFQ